jgi:hypothetical protein
MSRPSKLTPEVQAAIVQAIGLGASYKDAAAVAGISYETFNEWRSNGKGKYLQFSEAIEHEQSAAVLRHLAVINNAAAKGDWKASERWLRMYRPSEWQEQQRVDLSNSDGTLTPKGIDDESFERAITTLTATLREVIPNKDSGQNSDMGSAK